MPRPLVTFGYLCAGLVACLVGAGAVVFADERARAQAEAAGVQACVVAIAGSDPVRAAREDAARGEDRFYFLTHVGFDLTSLADGITVRSARNRSIRVSCRAAEAAFPFREIPFPQFAEHRFQDVEHCCADTDPPLTQCGLALDGFVRRYNAELARLRPEASARYCEPAS